MKLKRRELIRMGAAAAAAGAATPWLNLMASDEPLIMTKVPSSGIELPSVGVGTNRYRGAVGSADMKPLKECLETIFRLGGRVIDTSPNYGNSEEVLGALLKDMPGDMVAAFILPVIGCHDHLVPGVPPAADIGRKLAVEFETGMVHLDAVMTEPMAHAV